MWRLEDGYASYAMVDYTAGPLNDILVDVLCTLRFYAVRGWAHCAGRTTGRAERTICYALMSACMHTTGVD